MSLRKAAITAIAGVCLLTSAMTACTTRTRNATPRVQQQGTREQLFGTEVTPAPVPGQRLSVTPGPNNPVNQPPADNGRRADAIKNQLTSMKEINQVSVYVAGNVALVGYSPSNTAQDINTTKNMIINKVKQTDNTITNVTVSESADVMNRINQLRIDFTNNRPTNEITNDFNKIIQSLVPANR